MRHRRFQGLSEKIADVEVRLLCDFDKARRAGDVDLGEVIANDIEPDDQKTTSGKFGGHTFSDFAVSLRKRLSHAAPACSEITARFAGQRDTRERIRDGLPADQEDALIAIDNFRNVALCHDGPLTLEGERFQNAAKVMLVGA